jgi:hypothetical protein
VLVLRAGADDWREREAAEAAMADLGFEAIPLLRWFGGQTEDPEVRVRIEGAISMIHARLRNAGE